jgi:hypothetical protein
MYRTIKRRFESGNVKLVTVINTAGTIISLFIVLWIYCFIHDTKFSYNLTNITEHLSEELLRGVSCHGLITSILASLYLLGKQNEKIRIYYLFLSLGSLWLLFTTKSIWPSLFLGLCLGLFLPKDLNHLSSSIQFPDL